MENVVLPVWATGHFSFPVPYHRFAAIVIQTKGAPDYFYEYQNEYQPVILIEKAYAQAAFSICIAGLK